MDIYFTDVALQEYQTFKKKNDVKNITRIKDLLRCIKLHGPLYGIGKPEVLRYYDPTAYSRRINREHRLVYRIQENCIIVLSCRGHYKK